MKVADIKDGSGKVNVEGKIVEKEEPREVNTKFGRTRVSKAVLEDDSGTIVLTLWGDDTERVKEGDTVKVENGFAREWNNSVELSVGKFGKLTVVQ